MAHALAENHQYSSNGYRGCAEVLQKIRSYIADNFLLGTANEFDNSASLLETGIIDSTGAMELVAFLEKEFALSVADEELVPDNLDSVDKIGRFVERKIAVTG